MGRDTQRMIRAYTYSAGSLLLALATVLIVSNLRPKPIDFVPGRDLVFNAPLPILYWILAGILVTAALLCLFGTNTTLQVRTLLVLAAYLAGYRIVLNFMGATGGLKGYIGGVAEPFGLSPGAMAGLLAAIVGYLFVGSVIAIVISRAEEKWKRKNPNIKMACPQCGGHIQFYARNLGRNTPCPHCDANITLRKPDDKLKMSCFFCKGPIEFPAHAMGQKLRCPHCNKDITLKEAVVSAQEVQQGDSQVHR